jgi:hypothetical protein
LLVVFCFNFAVHTITITGAVTATGDAAAAAAAAAGTVKSPLPGECTYYCHVII